MHRRFAAIAVALFASACCRSPVSEGDGGAGTGGGATSGSTAGGGSSGNGGSTGGSTGGSSGTTGSTGGGPPSEAELCAFVWQGLARYSLLAELSGAQSPSGSYCQAPSPAQQAVAAAAQQALQAELVTLSAPDGGFGSGSGPSSCNDPASFPSQLAQALSASLAAGRLRWNGGAAATCQTGMAASGFLGASFGFDAGAGGAPPAWVGETIGVDGGGPCYDILQGQVTQGQSCSLDFDCQSGLFCKLGGTSSLPPCGGGSCQPFIAIGATCGAGDECAAGGSCAAGSCVASGPSGSSGDGGPGAVCNTNADCQACLSCSFSGSTNSSTCVALALAGAACTADYQCASPFLYCSGGGQCTPSPVVGQTGCLASSSQGCYLGWCEPLSDGGTLCAAPSGEGGACANDQSCAGQGTDYCQGADAGLLGSCAPYPGPGQPCVGFSCGPGAYCDTTSMTCGASLGRGAACQLGSQCQSGNCTGGQCQAPASSLCQITASSSPQGCAGGVSLLLGLGGALALWDRKRSRSHRPF
ncbi:MAG: hypothetical protein ACYCWW_19870 [Deltaproteobacteria bacterium]